MTVQWIPNHAGIEGNEFDKEAKKQAKLPPSTEHTHHQTLSSKIRKMKDNAWQLEWLSSYADILRPASALKPTSQAKSLPEPLLHPFSCAHARKHRLHHRCNKRQRQLAPEEVLGTPEGVIAFAKWAPATGLFHRRYGVGEENGVEE